MKLTVLIILLGLLLHANSTIIAPNHDNEVRKKFKSSLGLIGRIYYDEEIPQGWRLLKLRQGRQIKSELDKVVNQWEVIGFKRGKIDGSAYGSRISQKRGPGEVTELFVIKK